MTDMIRASSFQVQVPRQIKLTRQLYFNIRKPYTLSMTTGFKVM